MAAPRVASMICRPLGPASPLQCHVRPLASLVGGGGAAGSKLRFYVQLSHRPSHHQVQTSFVVDLGGRQARFESSSLSSFSASSDSKKRAGKVPPKPTIGRILRYALSDGINNLGRIARGKNLKEIVRAHPEEAVVALIVFIISVGGLFYTVYHALTNFYSESLTRLPDPVANSMRRALYYSKYSPDPQRALKYWNQALMQCHELKIDPFSDEVTGIRIGLSAWLWSIGQNSKSIEVLEVVLGECKKWVDTMEKAVIDGTAPLYPSAPGLKPPLPPAAATGKDKDGQEKKRDGDGDAAAAAAAAKDLENRETIYGKRTRILRRAIEVSVKLAELYTDEHVVEPELAHDHLLWSVQTGMAELKRRTTEGLRLREGDWMTAEQTGAMLEGLGTSFLNKQQAQLAVPLFFQALQLCQDPCHSAVIMNNLAASFAQHPIAGPSAALLVENDDHHVEEEKNKAATTTKPPATKGSPPSQAAAAAWEPKAPGSSPAEVRAVYLDYASNWAKNANNLAKSTKGEKRTQDCDEACAVSLCNLGNIARLLDDAAEARRRFEQCVEMSRELGFKAGVEQAEEGLRGLAAA